MAACDFLHVYVCTISRWCMQLTMFVCVSALAQMFIGARIGMCVHACVCMFICMLVHTFVCTCMQVRVYMCACVFVCAQIWVLRVTNLNGLPHSLLSYGHLIPGERACTGRTSLIKKFFQGPSKDRYIPWAVPEDSGYWLNGVLRGWSANG